MPKPGTYVVAVSGGVDSMALMHLLQTRAQQEPGWQLIVAHLDHGIRADSAEDRQLVQAVAENYDLPFVYKESHLGAKASEAIARKVRYEFLREVQKDREAVAIITAHHQGDVIETAIINMLRGTGRKGLTALISRTDVLRPLLNVPKVEIIKYAKTYDLQWREDSTNQDESYLRNYVRQQLLPRFSTSERLQLLSIINAQKKTNQSLDELLSNLSKGQAELDRLWFNKLGHSEALEVLASWLRANGIRNFDRKGLERLVVAAKVSRPGKQIDILGNIKLAVRKRQLALVGIER